MSDLYNDLDRAREDQTGEGRGGGLDLLVNGEPRSVPAGCTVEHLVHALGLETRKIAVAVNRDVVPRSSYGAQRLAAGDRVEILEAVGGG